MADFTKELEPLKGEPLALRKGVMVHDGGDNPQMRKIPKGTPIQEIPDVMLAQLHPDHFEATSAEGEGE